MWTLSQRKALLAMCLAGAVFLAVELHRQPTDLTDPAPDQSPRADEIQDRLNPNTADADDLAAIPNLGEKRAAEIVEYRENFLRQHPKSLAFRSLNDLDRLKGFGPATEANLAPYLVFGGSTTQPAE